MAVVNFTANLRRHVQCPRTEAKGATVHEVLEDVFSRFPYLRGYVVDEHGALRKHMAVFLDGIAVRDRRRLSDPVPDPGSEIHVIQALSGG